MYLSPSTQQVIDRMKATGKPLNFGPNGYWVVDGLNVIGSIVSYLTYRGLIVRRGAYQRILAQPESSEISQD